MRGRSKIFKRDSIIVQGGLCTLFRSRSAEIWLGTRKTSLRGGGGSVCTDAVPHLSGRQVHPEAQPARGTLPHLPCVCGSLYEGRTRGLDGESQDLRESPRHLPYQSRGALYACFYE